MATDARLQLPNETVRCRAGKHLIIFFMPLLFSIIVWATAYLGLNKNVSNCFIFFAGVRFNVCLVPKVLVAYFWLKQFLLYLTSSYYLTDQKFVLREGFFWLKSTEINLLNISEINLEQSLLGRLLGFGLLKINSFGGSTEIIVDLAQPEKFKQKLMELQFLMRK